MEHGMAVWADRDKILYRVNDIVVPDLSYGDDMVNVDEINAHRPVALLKIDAADLA